MFERIRQMVRKEFIQVFRDARTRGVVFLAPLIQVLVFGYAVSTDVRHVATAIPTWSIQTSSGCVVIPAICTARSARPITNNR